MQIAFSKALNVATFNGSAMPIVKSNDPLVLPCPGNPEMA
jgi:hypothetical protein